MIDPQHNSTLFQRQAAPVALPVEVWAIGRSRGEVVSLDQAAEPFVADDLVEHDRLICRRRFGRRGRQEVSRRMCPVVVVISDVVTNPIVEMLFAADQDVVQTFAIHRLHHAHIVRSHCFCTPPNALGQ